MWKQTREKNDAAGRFRRKSLLDFWEEEDAVGVVEMILILVVLIGLVVIFKDQLTSLVQTLLSKAASQSGAI